MGGSHVKSSYIHIPKLHKIYVLKRNPTIHLSRGRGGRRGIAPTHSRSQHYLGMSGQCHAPAALSPLGKDPRYPFDRRLLGPRGCLNTGVRGKILLPLPGIESRSPGRPVRMEALFSLSYAGSNIGFLVTVTLYLTQAYFSSLPTNVISTAAILFCFHCKVWNG
jgi:hypothetical protein